MMRVMMTSTLRTLLPSFGGRVHRQSARMSRFCFYDFDDFDDRQRKMMMMTMTTKPSPPNDSILRAMCFSSSRFSLS